MTFFEKELHRLFDDSERISIDAVFAGKTMITPNIDELCGFIQVPAIVESLQTGDYYPALVTLDLDSSCEHWGLCVMTPLGVIDHDAIEETAEEETFKQHLVPYRYWYTVNCESDIHVDMAECPEDIWDIISSATGQSFEQNGGMSL